MDDLKPSRGGTRTARVPRGKNKNSIQQRKQEGNFRLECSRRTERNLGGCNGKQVNSPVPLSLCMGFSFCPVLKKVVVVAQRVKNKKAWMG